MFIRKKSNPNSPRIAIQIVENIRIGKKIKQKIIRHVGVALNAREEEQLKNLAEEYMADLLHAKHKDENKIFIVENERDIILEGIKNNAKKKGRRPRKKLEDILPVDKVLLKNLKEEKRIIEGVDEIVGPLYDKLSYNKILPRKRDNNVLKDIVLTRLVSPLSKLKSTQILKEKFGKKVDIDCIYRMMDKLHPLIDNIKKLTFENTVKLCPGGLDIVLFDVTTLYMESVLVDELKNFGFSKDCKFNQVQVVLALATNSDGLAIGYELFPGNTAEVKTLISAIESWKKSFFIQSVCFIGDRAMFSQVNLRILEEYGYSYIIAAKLKTLPIKQKNEILDEKNYRPTVFNEDFGWIGEFAEDGRRLIVNYKSSRAKNDAKNRAEQLQAVRKRLKINKNTNSFITNQAVKKFTKIDGKSSINLAEEKILQEAQWDGIHGIITNVKHERAEDLIQKYSRLWIIEESFRINKHTLAMRPVYHWKKERIESHIAICYITFALLRQLQYRIKLRKKIPINQILETLMQVQSSILVDQSSGDKYKLPSSMTHTASEIYAACNLKRSLHPSIYIT